MLGVEDVVGEGFRKLQKISLKKACLIRQRCCIFAVLSAKELGLCFEEKGGLKRKKK